MTEASQHERQYGKVKRRVNGESTHKKWPRSKKEAAPIDGESSLSDPEAMKRRALKFASKPKAGFGLISRGEDLTLKHSHDARIELYSQVKAKIKQYKQEESEAQRDQILMMFRKLREGIIACNFKVDTEFVREVLKDSIWFSVESNHYQSYLPTLTYALESQDQWHFDKSEIELFQLLMCLHLSHSEHQHEAAFSLLLRSFVNEDLALEKDPVNCTLPERVYLLLSFNYINNSIKWLRVYRSLKDIESAVLLYTLLTRIALQTQVKNALQMLTNSYNVLKIPVIEQLTSTSWESLLEAPYAMPWQASAEQTVTFRGARKLPSSSLMEEGKKK